MFKVAQLILLFVGICLQTALTFQVSRTRSTVSYLNMGGGRSPAEKGVTTKNMFKDLRAKFNDAAKQPGFFETGDGPADIELFCKSNADGTQIGDCPFSQFIQVEYFYSVSVLSIIFKIYIFLHLISFSFDQLVMLKKGIRYNVNPTLPTTKPDWLVSKHEGKMPALVHKGVSMVDSIAIAEFLERTYPHNTLTRQGAYSYQEILEKTSGFFPALSACIKNKDASKDASLIAPVLAQLDAMDELLRSTPGQYLCGIEISLADLYLLPQLFHAIVTLERFKGLEIYHVGGNPTRPALENYLARMLDLEEFNDKRAYYNIDQVVYGWKVARGDL